MANVFTHDDIGWHEADWATWLVMAGPVIIAILLAFSGAEISLEQVDVTDPNLAP